MKLTVAEKVVAAWIAGNSASETIDKRMWIKGLNSLYKKGLALSTDKGIIFNDRHIDLFRRYLYNSSANQDICRQLVDREVYVCQSMLVTELLSQGFLNYEDISNAYAYRVDLHDGEEEFTAEQLEEKISELENEIAEKEDIFLHLTGAAADSVQGKIDELENDLSACRDAKDDPEPNEAYEWWLASNWWQDKAETYGHPILDSDYDTWWGRPTTGQSIHLDGLTNDIAMDMKILMGMNYCWGTNRTPEDFKKLINQ